MSVLERQTDEWLRNPPPRPKFECLPPRYAMSIILMSGAEIRLRRVIAEFGLDARTEKALVTIVLACSSVQSPDEVLEKLWNDPESQWQRPRQVGSDGPGYKPPTPLHRAQDLLQAAVTLMVSQGSLERVVVDASRQLTAAHGRLLLADKGAVSPDELTETQRDKWRARAKSQARRELQVASGWGAGEIADLVAVANTPAAVLRPIDDALGRGEVSWRLVRRFHRACSSLDHEDSAAIANGLFGSDPSNAVTERLTSLGTLTGYPWHHKEYCRALDREVAKVTREDDESAARHRDWKLASTDLWAKLDDDGTGTLTVRATATQVVAISERIEAGARLARHHGDERPLNQLRATLAATLLLHGTVDLPELPDDPALVTTEQTEALGKVVNALPTATLNVIVPLTLLNPRGTTAANSAGSANDATSAVSPPTQEARPPNATREHDPLAEYPDEPLGVAEVVGKHPLFLPGPDVRELALTPGSTMYRLLTDPTSGRCVERSTTAYRFDSAMRNQLLAADLTCRFPGCLIIGAHCQIDHVQEHGTPGGDTREANGALLSVVHHGDKTAKEWDAVINGNRDITWTSLLGRIYRTKAHDYMQYTRQLRAAIEHVENTPEADREAELDRLIYQAMSYRPPGAPLETLDDLPDPETTHALHGWDLVRLAHTDADGQAVNAPHPDATRREREQHLDTRTSSGARAEGAGRDDEHRGSDSDEDAPPEASRQDPPRRGDPWQPSDDDQPPF
ncbi:MAG TPA: HNH endonuclease signature motif containing protein [Ornithinicoccus sp.]|nr:HNH endonuclease signature motif containing protein [Ornithinicoccus sp.]